MNADHILLKLSDGALRAPDTALAKQAQRLAIGLEEPWLANHSLRTYYFARLIADQRGLRAERDWDDELLFVACVLHDIGLTPSGDGIQRFEVDGADTAVTYLSGLGLETDRASTVWQAIALHTTGGIAERMRPEIALTRAGVMADLFGHGLAHVPYDNTDAILSAYPRLDQDRTVLEAVSDAIVAQVALKPAKAVPYTLAAHLAAERGIGRRPAP